MFVSIFFPLKAYVPSFPSRQSGVLRPVRPEENSFRRMCVAQNELKLTHSMRKGIRNTYQQELGCHTQRFGL